MNRVFDVDAVSSLVMTNVSLSSFETSLALSDTYGDSCEDVSRLDRERTGCVVVDCSEASDGLFSLFSSAFEGSSVGAEVCVSSEVVLVVEVVTTFS